MNICIYSPYIPKHRGGGEMYILQVAQALQYAHSVSIALPHEVYDSLTPTEQSEILANYESFFSLSLKHITFVRSPLGSAASWWQKWWWTRKWDVLYYLTDGSIFPSYAKNNILHVQVPLRISKKSIWERYKLSCWDVINTNSEFTKKCITTSWPTRVDFVHSPYVELPRSVYTYPIKKKEAYIVHIGRFFTQQHSKKQDVIIDTFIQLRTKYPSDLKNWKLVLIGGIEDQEYVRALHRKASGHPIEFYHDATRKTVLDWLTKASLYWHATGFGIDQLREPEKVEHFGISTIEAMSAGCVPVVINAGGQPEILGSELAECLWNTQNEWMHITHQLITNSAHRAKLGSIARLKAQDRNRDTFESMLTCMIRNHV